MRSGNDTTPYSTDYEIGVAFPGIETNCVVSHDKIQYNREEFLNDMPAFIRFEKGEKVHIEGTLDAEQLLAVFLALQQEIG